MAPGARSKFGVPMFEPEIFRKQMYCIKESICDIVGTFQRHPQRFCAPVVTRRLGNYVPLAPLHYAPACVRPHTFLSKAVGCSPLQEL